MLTDICFECDISEKLTECCGSHPETREYAPVSLDDGSIVQACPNMTSDAMCCVFDSSDTRPGQCYDNFCHKYAGIDLVTLLHHKGL